MFFNIYHVLPYYLSCCHLPKIGHLYIPSGQSDYKTNVLSFFLDSLQIDTPHNLLPTCLPLVLVHVLDTLNVNVLQSRFATNPYLCGSQRYQLGGH